MAWIRCRGDVTQKATLELTFMWDLENSMDCIVHGITKSRTPLSHVGRGRGSGESGREVKTWYINTGLCIKVEKKPPRGLH